MENCNASLVLIMLSIQSALPAKEVESRVAFVEKRITELKSRMAAKKFTREAPSRRQQAADKVNLLFFLSRVPVQRCESFSLLQLAAFESELEQLQSAGAERQG